MGRARPGEPVEQSAIGYFHIAFSGSCIMGILIRTLAVKARTACGQRVGVYCVGACRNNTDMQIRRRRGKGVWEGTEGILGLLWQQQKDFRPQESG